MKFLISSSIILLVILAGCKKNKTAEQLPPETQKGEFTFGCKVDGKVYTAKGKDGLLAFDYVSYVLVSSDSSINIFAVNTGNDKPKFGFELTIKYLGYPGIYELKTYPYEGIFRDNNNGSLPRNSNTYTTSENNIGSLIVKYFNGSFKPYNKGKILSGTFEMDAVNAEGKVIHIIEGRFDIGQ